LTLYERIPTQHRREPYIIEGAGHENIVDHDINGYFRRVQAFLNGLSANGGTTPSVATAHHPYPMSARTAPAAVNAGAPQPIIPVRGDGIDHHSVQTSCESRQ